LEIQFYFIHDTKYVNKSEIILIAGEFLTSAKFCRNIKIPWQRKNAAAWLEIPQPAENCGP